MRVPNADRAVIAPETIRDYLLNPAHRRGGSKARLLLACTQDDIMAFELFSDVILTENLLSADLRAGDVGTVVERHTKPGVEDGYSVEFFDMTGNTIAVVTVRGSKLRLPTRQDRPAVRPVALPA